MSNFSNRGVMMERKDCIGCGHMEVLKGGGGIYLVVLL